MAKNILLFSLLSVFIIAMIGLTFFVWTNLFGNASKTDNQSQTVSGLLNDVNIVKPAITIRLRNGQYQTFFITETTVFYQLEDSEKREDLLAPPQQRQITFNQIKKEDQIQVEYSSNTAHVVEIYR